MRAKKPRAAATLQSIAAELEEAGANLTLVTPESGRIAIGHRPDSALVAFHTREALTALLRRDHLALAEAYLDKKIDFSGDAREIMKWTDLVDIGPTWIERIRLWLRLLLRNRVRYDRESIAFHYDRPPEFFLPWLDRWRSYSHGFYDSPEDGVSDAQARKMQFAIDALGLKPGMEVFDMGGGWGCFVEFAGRQGISVHTITISEEQFRFVNELIRTQNLPCTIEMVNFFEYHPTKRFDGAVFMGTFEHVPEYGRVAQFLARHLKPGARVYADFCAQRSDFILGGFMKKYIWPGPVRYVNPQKLISELIRAGFNIHELKDDTLSYAYTVRDWGDALEAGQEALAARFGQSSVRAFLLFLRGSYYFLIKNKTQAYHLVAGLEPANLRG
jgi:cyclopropane-fatty-acyl-phospholipid synthase